MYVMIIGSIMILGCTVVRETQPDRTATEQLILSHAVIDAVRQIKADAVAGKKVMLDLSYLKTVDIEFTKGELRDRLLQLGAELVADIDMAEIIVEARSSGLGIDDSKTMIASRQFLFPSRVWVSSRLLPCHCTSMTSNSA